MEIILNGEKQKIPEGMTVLDLIQQLGFPTERLAVELNLKIVKREQWASSALNKVTRLKWSSLLVGGLERPVAAR